jgi:hypothetical protein
VSVLLGASLVGSQEIVAAMEGSTRVCWLAVYDSVAFKHDETQQRFRTGYGCVGQGRSATLGGDEGVSR